MFVHQKVFLKGLKEARFGGEQAEIWEMGGGDVRLVVRLFGELRGVLELEKEDGEGEENAMLEVEVEEGLKEEWSGFWDVEEMGESQRRVFFISPLLTAVSISISIWVVSQSKRTSEGTITLTSNRTWKPLLRRLS